MDAALLELMPHSVTVAPYVSQNTDGEVTYGTAVAHQCLVEYKTEVVKFARIGDPQGKTVISRATVYLGDVANVNLRDKVTLPDGTTPQILAVHRYADPAGDYYTEIHV